MKAQGKEGRVGEGGGAGRGAPTGEGAGSSCFMQAIRHPWRALFMQTRSHSGAMYREGQHTNKHANELPAGVTDGPSGLTVRGIVYGIGTD